MSAQNDDSKQMTNTPSTSRAPTLALWRQRLAAVVGATLCIVFLVKNLSSTNDDLTIHRRLMSSRAAPIAANTLDWSQAVPDLILSTDGKLVTSYMIPPKPSEVPRKRAYGGMGIDSVVKEKQFDFLSQCKITSQVRVIASSPKWIVQTIDEYGVDKFVGGDELYITYTDEMKSGLHTGDKPTAVALVTDLLNGRYELEFVTTPMDPTPKDISGNGILRVYFQFSCGIGFIAPNGKMDWKQSGSSHFFHKLVGVIEPPMRNFVAPSLDGICFPDFHKVVGVGDSVLNRFIINIPKSQRRKIYGSLGTGTVDQKLKFIEDHFGEYLNKGTLPKALVIGSATWDVLMNDHRDPFFKDHLVAVRNYVNAVKKAYPRATIMWMSPNALHSHRINCKGRESCAARTKYLSSSRAAYLNTEQKKIMKQMDVPYLDLFEAYYLSAEYSLSGDGRHFTNELTETMMHWFHDENECKGRLVYNDPGRLIT